MTILNAICSAYKAFKATMKGEVAEESYKPAFSVNQYASLVGKNKQLEDQNAELVRKLELAKKLTEDSEDSEDNNPTSVSADIKAAKASVYWDIAKLLQAEQSKFLDEISAGNAPHYISKQQFNYIADKIYSIFTSYRRNNID